MKNHSYLYVVMIAVAAVTLWVIVKAGNKLQATADLAGEWTFESGPLGPNADGPEHLGKGFHLDQSGRFLRIRFDNGRQLSLRANKIPQGKVGTSPQPVELSDGAWELSGTVWEEAGRLSGSFNLRGPERARFIAYRDLPEPEKSPAVAPNPPKPAKAMAAAESDAPLVAISDTPSAEPVAVTQDNAK